MRATRKLSGLVLACALLLSAHGRADDARDPAAAEELFRQGRTASEKRDFSSACAKFRESNRLDPAVGTVFNIADCEEKLGRLATSWTLFQEVVQRLLADDDRRAIAQKRAAALEARVPKLSIRLAHPDAPGVVVRRDGVVLGAASLDTPLPVDPGEHVVVVEAPGTQNAEFRAQIAEGARAVLDVATGAPTPAQRLDQPATGAPAGSASQSNRSAAYLVGAVGVAGLLTGAIAGAVVLHDKSTVDSECVDKRCSQTGLDAAHSGKTMGILSTAGLLTGAIGLGAATYLFVSAPTPSENAHAGAYFVGIRAKW